MTIAQFLASTVRYNKHTGSVDHAIDILNNLAMPLIAPLSDEGEAVDIALANLTEIQPQRDAEKSREALRNSWGRIHYLRQRTSELNAEEYAGILEDLNVVRHVMVKFLEVVEKEPEPTGEVEDFSLKFLVYHLRQNIRIITEIHHQAVKYLDPRARRIGGMEGRQ